jgi:hypothetical protein
MRLRGEGEGGERLQKESGGMIVSSGRISVENDPTIRDKT